MQQIVRDQLRQQDMVLVGMPLGLHVLFGVPMCLALQMAADKTHSALHNRHRVAVGIGGNRIKLAVHEGRAVIKIHALRLTAPLDRGRGAVRGAYVGARALDVLHTARAFQ